MIETDKALFIEMLTMVSDIYATKLTESQVIMFWQLLADYDYQAVKTALLRCAKECKFMPKPVEIIERLQGTTAADAEQALAQIYDRLYRGSIYKNYKFIKDGKPDTVLMQTLADCGGMVDANDKISHDTYWRKKFIDRYQQNARHADNCHVLKTTGANPAAEAIQIEYSPDKKLSLPGAVVLELEGVEA